MSSVQPMAPLRTRAGGSVSAIILLGRTGCIRSGYESGGDGGTQVPFQGPLAIDDNAVAAVNPSELPQTGNPCAPPILVRVTQVLDGDTFEAEGVSEQLTSPTRVRVIGVDTPEIGHAQGEVGECFGAEAQAFTEQLERHLVWLTHDAACEDGNGRRLAYVHTSAGPEGFYERQLLRRGFGTVLSIAPNVTHRQMFESDMNQARNEMRGLWSYCEE